MIINEKTEIRGKSVILVPYEEAHVPKYHQWMQSEELLAATASERLTLDEEYAMQKSWRNDNDKLTFIVLDKNKTNEGEECAMIGDTNLFIIDDGVAEVMIMIAESSYRKRGFGQEALSLILLYGIEALSIKRYEAKITSDNAASISLFKKFGFEVTAESSVFKEITLTKMVDDDWLKCLSVKHPYNIVERT